MNSEAAKWIRWRLIFLVLTSNVLGSRGFPEPLAQETTAASVAETETEVISWCSEECKCQANSNDYDDEYDCRLTSSTSGTTTVIKIFNSDQNFDFVCERIDDEEGFSFSKVAEKLRVNFSDVIKLTIDACPSPGDVSYEEVIRALGVTALEELVITADARRPVHLSKYSFINLTIQGLELSHPGFTLPQDLFPENFGIRRLQITDTKLPKLPNFSPLSNLVSLKISHIISLSDSLTSETFQNLRNLKFLSLTHNRIRELPKFLLDPLVNLEDLKLSGNAFSSIPSGFLSRNLKLLNVSWYEDGCGCVRKFPPDMFPARNCPLRHFRYSRNNKEDDKPLIVPPNLFASCSNLSSLLITGSKLIQDDLKTLAWSSPNLKSLSLYKNKIGALAREDIPPNVELIWLSHNPFSCQDCQTIYTLSDLKLRRNRLQDYEFVTCLLSDGNETSIADAYREFCTTGRINLYIAIGIITFFLLFLIALISIVFASEKIQRKLYYHEFWSIFFRTESCDNLKYDAFMSYAEEDSTYVADYLIPLLEEGKYPRINNSEVARVFRCCCHQRDWEVGSEIMTNIINSVNESSRTIVVLSSNYLKSEWCHMEFDEAYIRRKVILIMRVDHPSPSELEACPSIKRYIETFTYLKEDDPEFWEKLIYLLPHRKMKNTNNNPNRTTMTASAAANNTTEMQEIVRNTS